MVVTPKMSPELSSLGCHHNQHPYRDSSHTAPASHLLPASGPVVQPHPEDAQHQINPKLSYQPPKIAGEGGEVGALSQPQRFTPRLLKPLSQERSGGRSRSAFFLHPNSFNFHLFRFFSVSPHSSPKFWGGPGDAWHCWLFFPSSICVSPDRASPKNHLTPFFLLKSIFGDPPKTFLPSPAPH